MNEFEKYALEVATASPCKKRKVGAVLVYDNCVVSSGYNYDPSSVSCELTDGSTKISVIHAETAALCKLTCNNKKVVLVPNATYILYVTNKPCEDCEAYINNFANRFSITIQVKVVEQLMKFDAGKLRYDLIPPSAMEGLAEVLTYGAKKYKPNGWKNNSISCYTAALYRHLEAWRKGEKKDEESGMAHLKHALTNVVFLLEIDND